MVKISTVNILNMLVFFAFSMALSVVPVRSSEQGELSIITSYPPSFFEPFRLAFEKQYPEVRVSIAQRNTASANRFIMEKPDITPDIFWASAADAFELLKRKQALRPIRSRPTGAPQYVLGYPVNDPEGYYLGFALSGYGIVYSPSYLLQHNLPIPRNWDDLLKPVYSGHIGITSPSRSGTTHLIVEVFLQTYGWEKGWAMLSKLGGNLSTVTARSFGVASGVAQKRFGIGITIDFLAQPLDDAHTDNVFIMPPDAIYTPANIAILRGAKNITNAERFVDFLLSEQGQKILRYPGINRIPVLSKLNKDLLPAPDRRGLMNMAEFDPHLSAERYGLVNLIFDNFIIRRRATLGRLWRKVNELEAAKFENTETLSTLARARQLLSTPPLSAHEANILSEDLKTEWPRSVARTAEQEQFSGEIRRIVEHNLAMIETLLSSVSPVTNDKRWYR